jgi:hypothetical protein
LRRASGEVLRVELQIQHILSAQEKKASGKFGEINSSAPIFPLNPVFNTGLYLYVT